VVAVVVVAAVLVVVVVDAKVMKTQKAQDMVMTLFPLNNV